MAAPIHKILPPLIHFRSVTKSSRGYQIAVLYNDAGDYETAKRYLSEYISTREAVPQAHKLMGQIHESANNNEQAIASYKRSLELDSKQKDLILKVCELYNTSKDVDIERLKKNLLSEENHLNKMAHSSSVMNSVAIEPTSISKEETNYLRIVNLLLRVTPPIVRQKFDREFYPGGLQTVLNQNKSKVLTELSKKHVINKKQWELLFPQKGNALSKTFDLSLMLVLIRHLTPIQIGDKLPVSSLTDEGADLTRLKYYRNELRHNDDGTLTDTEFEKWWNDICQAIIRLGGQQFQQTCAELKGRRLDDNDREILRELRNIDKSNDPIPPGLKDLKVPNEIRKLDKKSIEIYLKTMESGTEKKRDIRLIIVGKKGAGKTCLVRRLLGETISDVKSTNGLEIHRRRCQIRTKDGRWIKIEGVYHNDVNKRLVMSVTKNLERQNENESTVSRSTESNKTDKLEILYQRDTEIEMSTSCNDSQPLNTNVHKEDAIPLNEAAVKELQDILKSKYDLDEEEYANLTLWDFAGDKEFYETHQTFLSPDAIYLVVLNLNDDNKEESKVAFKFWFDSIHCYATLKDQAESVTCNPPIIVVGTNTDKITEGVTCNDIIIKQIDGLSKEGKSHLQCNRYHLVSNTKDEEPVFELLRHDILKAAKRSAKWNFDYPVKFIQLEKCLEIERASGKYIITFNRIQQIGLNMSKPLTDDLELSLFLKQHHELGNIVYFEDIPNYIVLDPQWLADSFRCLITAEIFQRDLLCYDEWKEFKENGKMFYDLLNAIFSKQPEQIREHQHDVLAIMEKFNMIIKPKFYPDTATAHKQSYFYVPCKIMSKPTDDIDKMFNVSEDQKSICLCYVFNYLPPHLVNHVIVSCCNKYNVAMVNGTRPSFFRGIGVFDVSENRCTKLLVAEYERVLQFQIWEWNKWAPRQLSDIYDFIKKEINKIVVTRYKMTNIVFEEKWKCCYTKYDFFGGFQDFGTIRKGEPYYCEEHKTTHEYKNEWFTTPDLSEFTQQQINFARMCMVVLDLLTDVLYDRLKLDKLNVPQRDTCDTTLLYSEHRKLKKHVPTKNWGGQWNDIDPHNTNIGDDIERIRLIRNEMQHAKSFWLEEKRYCELCDIIMELLTRFDHHNTPAGESYVDRFTEIRKSELKAKQIKESFARFDADKQKTQICVAEKMYVAETINVYNCS